MTVQLHPLSQRIAELRQRGRRHLDAVLLPLIFHGDITDGKEEEAILLPMATA